MDKGVNWSVLAFPVRFPLFLLTLRAVKPRPISSMTLVFGLRIRTMSGAHADCCSKSRNTHCPEKTSWLEDGSQKTAVPPDSFTGFFGGCGEAFQAYLTPWPPSHHTVQAEVTVQHNNDFGPICLCHLRRILGQHSCM
ncbi:hypothetical protein PoB_004076800 [Plakobranchus ocellatus]|uniref:Secreted protein n=1 Tax=Plakobranchus ocellatus TaxID=259542 RepID=A0AAV4B657_9GAST|nr:hypothetical protein PoB_004076800 [Plakobranchus ocellatus]